MKSKPSHSNANQKTTTTTPSHSVKSEGDFFGPPQTSPKPFFPIQTKLHIGSPNDRFEQEADATADRVVQNDTAPNIQNKQAPPSISNNASGVLQQKPIFESNEENATNTKVQGKNISIQRKEEPRAKSNQGLESTLNSSKGKGSEIDPSTRQEMESSMGASFKNVRIHTGSEATKMNKQLGAQAFTHGSDIYFNTGQYNTQSKEGKHLLAHELTHTVQQGATNKVSKKPLIQRKVSDYEKAEDANAPMKRMNEKVKDEVGDDAKVNNANTDQPTPPPPANHTDQEEERPSKGELGGIKGEVKDDAKPDVDREQEQKPKIEKNTEKVKKSAEEGGELKGNEQKNPEPDKKKPLKSPAELAKAEAIAAFTKVKQFKAPPPEKEMNPLEEKEAVDAKGDPLLVDPQHDTRLLTLLAQIQLYRHQGLLLKTKAIQEKAKAFELKGSIAIGHSAVYQTEEIIDKFFLHSQARRENVENMEMHLEESNRRVDWVEKEAPPLAEKAKEGKGETTSMSKESKDKQAVVKQTPSDPENNENKQQNEKQFGETSDNSVQADDVMGQSGEMIDNLIKEAAESKERNTKTKLTLGKAHENVTNAEHTLKVNQQKNAAAKAKYDGYAQRPDELFGKAHQLEMNADLAIQKSHDKEAEIHELHHNYYNQLKSVPGQIYPDGPGDQASGSGAPIQGKGIIQRRVFSDQEAQLLAKNEEERKRRLAAIQDEQIRKLAENEIEMVANFDKMTGWDKMVYALGVTWNTIMGGASLNKVPGFFADMFKAIFWPPSMAEAMWTLMWPETKNDHPLIASFKYIAGWTSAASVLFGSIFAFSLVGFLVGVALACFIFTNPIGLSIMSFTAPIIKFSGAMFKWITIISAIFHTLVIAFDLYQAANAPTSKELTDRSDQLAEDTSRSLTAYAGVLLMGLSRFLGNMLKGTKLGVWAEGFKVKIQERIQAKTQARADLKNSQANGKTGGNEPIKNESGAQENNIGQGKDPNNLKPAEPDANQSSAPKNSIAPEGLSETLKTVRKGLKDPRAIQQFDDLFKKMGNNPDKMEGAVKGMQKKGNLEIKLIEQWKKIHNSTLKPHGDAIGEVSELKGQAEKLLKEVESFESSHPETKGVSEMKKGLRGEIKRLGRMEKGEIEASTEGVQGTRNNIEGVQSEFDLAKSKSQVTGVNQKFSLDGVPDKVEVDVVSEGGQKWTDAKRVKSFGLESSDWIGNAHKQGLKAQVQKLLRSAQQNPVNGKPPVVEIEFPLGVSREVAAALKKMGAKVTGKIIKPFNPKTGGPIPPDDNKDKE